MLVNLSEEFPSWDGSEILDLLVPITNAVCLWRETELAEAFRTPLLRFLVPEFKSVSLCDV